MSKHKWSFFPLFYRAVKWTSYGAHTSRGKLFIVEVRKGKIFSFCKRISSIYRIILIKKERFHLFSLQLGGILYQANFITVLRHKEGDYEADPLSPLLLFVQATPCLTSCLVLEGGH